MEVIIMQSFKDLTKTISSKKKQHYCICTQEIYIYICASQIRLELFKVPIFQIQAI